MTYKEAIDYLFSSAPLFQNIGAGAYKEGLSNTFLLDNHFGNPHKKYKTIHVAGTNGKGSCSHTIAAILQSAGYKVGLYTSPHLIDFKERIRINGKPVDEEFVVRFVEEIRTTYGKDIDEGKLGFSFFELATSMAFKYFADEGIDIAVVEVGLGGRLDCTNIISPILSVITNISFDHTQFLGSTLEQIAAEKAGIIKQGVPVVIGETTKETKNVFLNKAKEMDAPIFFAEENDFDIELNTQLRGYCQEKNTKTILTAISQLRMANEDNIKEGFSHVCELTGLMGRWQKVHDKPLVVCDTGHNVGGWQYLAKQIAETPCRQRHIIVGFVNDKDISGILNLIKSTILDAGIEANTTFYFTQASVQRALPAEELQRIAQKYNLIGNTFPTVEEAYLAATSTAADNDFIYVGGSNFIVADLLTLIQID